MSYIAIDDASDALIAERKLVRLIAIIAISSVALGFLMQILIFFVKIGLGGHWSQGQFLVQLGQGITWSALVCTGVGLGTTLSNAKPSVIGMLGFVSAPLAVAASKFSQKLMAGLLNAAAEPAALSLFTLSTLRAVEYGILGWLLGKLARNSELRPAVSWQPEPGPALPSAAQFQCFRTRWRLPMGVIQPWLRSSPAP